MCKPIHRLLPFLCLIASITMYGQYTETINSNRPGESQGAFSVGTQVLQVETGLDLGNDTHSLLNTDIDITGFNLDLRYGFWKEALEISSFFRYQSNNIAFTTGSSDPRRVSGIENLQLGAKYLIYDPYKKGEDEPNLYSYHANFKFKWKTLIPAISVYAGGVFDFTNDLDTRRPDGISPNIAIITQNNWGRWVWVNNIIADRVTSEFPGYSWITTMTHSFNPKIAAFFEYQLITGDLYADNLIRGGGAYLITKNLQVDISGLINFKDTPSRWNIATGLSWRLDLHKKDERIEDTSGDEDEDGKKKKKSASQRQAEKINKKNKKKRRDSVDPDGGDDGDNL
ncbi:transporter [Dokdonia pacifica]|uniref:Putative MetA-pathway of phenol degradation n=1 Tax=Dokdonia pacifica TaxID=1627892 RepID=A0A239DUW4_9FLAO|nr:transporter [Dokdonia pacifica]SNS36256.1 Putative MetA-pathway of phenol degradation [Dokdonia pacifica]